MDKQEKLEKIKNIIKIPEVKVKAKPTHRFYCDACTGIAFYYVEGEPNAPMVACQSCGALVDTSKKENYIKL